MFIMAPKTMHRIERSRMRQRNTNYGKLMKSLHKKLEKLWTEYGTDVYLLARRNGRSQVFSSLDQPPDQDALVSSPLCSALLL